MALAIFDLDDTLVDCDSEGLWLKFMVERGLVDAQAIQRVIEFTRTYAVGQMDFDQYEVFFLNLFKELPAEVLRDSLAGFLELVRSHLRPEVLERLNRHRAQGDRILLITATSVFLSRPIAELLGVADLIATQSELDTEGRPTGKIIGTIPFQSRKVILLEAWLREHGCSLEDSWGYSDSCNDLPLLQKTAHPVAVAPDKILRDHALEHGWEVLLDGGGGVLKEFIDLNTDLVDTCDDA